MKGVILNINPCAQIVDISHEIDSQDIEEGGYVLSTSYDFFPEGTVHVAVVDPGVGGTRNIIAVQSKKYIFIAPDNGLLKYVFYKEDTFDVFEISNKTYFLNTISSTFHGRDIFAPVSAYLSLGTGISAMGRKTVDYYYPEIKKPHFKENAISGSIIHIDRFGNLITNISRHYLEKFNLYNSLRIHAGKSILGEIKECYSSVEEGAPVALFSSSGFLEIGMNKGNAQEALNLNKGDKIEIKAK